MDSLLTGLALVGGGTVALALVSGSAGDLGSFLRHAFVRPLAGDAGRRARAFWGAASRNAVLLGALGAAFGLAGLLGSGKGLAGMAEGLGERAFGPPILGLVLAALCGLPACRQTARAADAESPAGPPAPPKWLRVETGLGYAAFLALLVAVFPATGTQPSLRPVDLLLRTPAWVAVAAGAVAIALYLGDPRRGRSVVAGITLAGGAAALLGLLQGFHGMAIARIETVAGGLVFSLSASVATLVGLAAVAFPIEDRAVAHGEGSPSRLAGYGVPLAAVLLVAIVWLMVVTPMTAPR
jgi:hypothetical protein